MIVKSARIRLISGIRGLLSGPEDYQGILNMVEPPMFAMDEF